MAKRSKSRGYVAEWMKLAGLKQAELVKLLGYSKAKANAVWHAEQRLNEDIMEEIAPLVHARPYELLMHPEEAHRLRRLQALVQDAVRQVDPEPEAAAPIQRKAG